MNENTERINDKVSEEDAEKMSADDPDQTEKYSEDEFQSAEEVLHESSEHIEDEFHTEEKVLPESTEHMENELHSVEEIQPEPAKKESKQQKATRLVAQARNIVKESDDQSTSCKLQLMEDLEAYDDAKKKLKEGGFDACDELLEKLGYSSRSDELVEEAVVFENKSILEPIEIKDVSSGKFTALLSAVTAGGITAIGLVYLATEKLGMTLNVGKVPSVETTQNIVSWFSTMIGVEPNVYLGAGVFGLCVLLVMLVIYMIRVNLKANSNLHFTVKQFVEAELYAEQKSDCQEEMEKIDAHMKETIKTFKTYEILFNEQQGKLQRILHIEGEKEKATAYHEKSFAEIHETKKLIRTIRDFMAIPMSEEGKLSTNSVQRLEQVKIQMDHMIERLY